MESSNLFQSLKSTLKESASVANLKPKTTVETRDLHALTTKEEVIESALGEPVPDPKINISPPNSREQVRAYITCTKADTMLRQS